MFCLGKVYFGCLEWSNKEDKLHYVAEKKYKKAVSFFKKSTGDEKEDVKTEPVVGRLPQDEKEMNIVWTTLEEKPTVLDNIAWKLTSIHQLQKGSIQNIPPFTMRAHWCTSNLKAGKRKRILLYFRMMYRIPRQRTPNSESGTEADTFINVYKWFTEHLLQ